MRIHGPARPKASRIAEQKVAVMQQLISRKRDAAKCLILAFVLAAVVCRSWRGGLGLPLLSILTSKISSVSRYLYLLYRCRFHTRVEIGCLHANSLAAERDKSCTGPSHVMCKAPGQASSPTRHLRHLQHARQVPVNKLAPDHDLRKTCL